ncbi:hypothetical protein SUGI_0004740 [Cryptomeria japonica]|uniref:E3 ubiquitin-protein ligase ORTHRUS 2 n=1 Tax=Cryptomeria japonica TaxID=3369 RepID=UPI002408C502|nr:E3 ubiquitin-protein ligase ORTHRUS 2 [Cryptomeria japonica]GLJ04851.1 hypothetical protein SUGI_0004740 [Cryptomeria japonica]
MADLPCDGDGVCMVCKVVPPDCDVLLCNSCVSPWHMQCLNPPLTAVPVGDWFCPDCSITNHEDQQRPCGVKSASDGDDLISQIRAIQADPNLTEDEKAKKRQALMARGQGKKKAKEDEKGEEEEVKVSRPRRNELLELFDESLNCIFCMQLPERPVTTPCGHNFCLKCFQKWMAQGKKNCAKCRSIIPSKMSSQPRINSTLVMAIRMAKAAAANSGDSSRIPKVYVTIENQNKPDKAFTTERAKKTGIANAASGRIFVTVPPDHFGPILAQNDPERNQGVLVGECWGDRMECRQWGVHLPHVAGISGQADYGAQSVALSGGYEDDEDHGEWFLYTGSGGRDLSGNKRTNKEQSFDQTFDKYNEALRVSCKMGYPVRVVRSHKEKRSSYAPETGVRYDGIYRIEKCWRKKGIQGFKVCRYLFVRCDNEPAPWTSDEHGDRPRPLPKIDEFKNASDITDRKREPSWDWKGDRWGWIRDPPASRRLGSSNKRLASDGSRSRDRPRQFMTIQQRLLKEFSCSLCKKVLTLPISTPCGHNFCKSCIEGLFAGQQDVRERTTVSGRSLRTQKIVKKCPSCQGDINDFLVNPQVNRQMEDVIRSLKRKDEDGSESDGDGKEDGVQCGDAEKEDMETENCLVQATEDSNEPKATPVDRSESLKVTDGEGSIEVEEKCASDKKVHADSDKRPLDPEKEKAIRQLHCKYSRYSEELLRSMLADQEGDVNELEALLRTLQRQETRANRVVSNSPASKHKNKDASLHSTVLEETDTEVLNANESNINAARPEATVKGIDAKVSEEDCTEKETIEPVESSPVRQQNNCTGETKQKSSRKRRREVPSPAPKIYQTRHRGSKDIVTGSAAVSETPTKNNLQSPSPSSPLVVISDSDFE